MDIGYNHNLDTSSQTDQCFVVSCHHIAHKTDDYVAILKVVQLDWLVQTVGDSNIVKADVSAPADSQRVCFHWVIDLAQRPAHHLTVLNHCAIFQLVVIETVHQLKVVVAEKYIGKTIEEVKFREDHNVLILTIIRDTQEKSFLGRSKTVANVQGIPEPTTVLQRDDIIVIYGANEDLQKFAKSKSE